MTGKALVGLAMVLGVGLGAVAAFAGNHEQDLNSVMAHEDGHKDQDKGKSKDKKPGFPKADEEKSDEKRGGN
ncbi:MAG: hypothetical protein AB1411_15820 [Nitrospirota bacterium]